MQLLAVARIEHQGLIVRFVPAIYLHRRRRASGKIAQHKAQYGEP